MRLQVKFWHLMLKVIRSRGGQNTFILWSPAFAPALSRLALLTFVKDLHRLWTLTLKISLCTIGITNQLSGREELYVLVQVNQHFCLRAHRMYGCMEG